MMCKKTFFAIIGFVFLITLTIGSVVIPLPVKAAEVNSYDDYSSVFLSSRWWREGTLDENFNSQVTGVAPVGWLLNNQTGGSINIAEVPDSADKSIRIYDNDNTMSVNAVKAFDSISNPATIEFNFKMDAVKEGVLVCNLQNSSGVDAVSILADNDGFKYYDGTTLTNIQTYTANTWYHFKITVDSETDKMYLYIDDLLKISGGNFKNNVLGISKIMIGGSVEGYDVTGYWDNMKIIEAGYLVYDNFKGQVTGAAPQGWTLGNLPGGSITVEEIPSSTDKSMRVCDNDNSATVTASKIFTAQSTETLVEFDFKMNEVKEGAIVCYLNNAVSILASSNGFGYIDSGTYTFIQTYNADTWYHFKIVANPANDKMDLFIDGVLKVSGGNFRNAVSQINEIIIGGSTSGTGVTAYWDNIRVYKDLPINSHPGTLDIMKRFMTTDDKWSYITDEDQVSAISDLGVGFQGTLSSTVADTKVNPDDPTEVVIGRAQKFDGSSLKAPWMTWYTAWGCINNPDYIQILRTIARSTIDAGGNGIQFDDWSVNKAAYEFDGCFCSYCMEGFRQYLDDTYTNAQLLVWGINDITVFNYKTYLQQNYNIYTNDDYAAHKAESPLYVPFGDFQYKSTKDFHMSFKQELDTYAGKQIEYSNNNGGFLESFYDLTKHYWNDMFSYGIGEHHGYSHELTDIVTGGTFATGLGKPQVISPDPQDVTIVRQGIAAAYSLGQYFLVPWDIWMSGSQPRYFGIVDNYGDIFQFIRQYDFLFDGYEVPAKVGILIKWDSINISDLRDLSMNIFSSGVPFSDLIANYVDPVYNINSGKLSGLSYIVEYSPVSGFSQEDQLVINNSGITVVPTSTVTSNWLTGITPVTVTGNSNVYAAMRAKPSDVNAPKVIHLLNRNSSEVQNTSVTIADADFFGSSNISAVLFRPGEDPKSLTITDLGNGKHEILVPNLGIWGIVRISKTSVASTDEYAVPVPYSGINLGSPDKVGSASYSGGSFTVKSKGTGFDLQTSGDIYGSSDQLSFVYSNIKTAGEQDFSISANLASQSGGENGSLTGIMVRETPASNSKFISLVYNKGSGLELKWRDTDNAHVYTVDLGAVTLPVYLKLEKKGNIYYAYKSNNGSDWGSALGSYTINFSTKIGGVCVSSNSEMVENIGVFDSLDITYGMYIVDDDFNYQTTGSAPEGWILSYESSGSVIVAEVPSTNDKSMKIVDNDNSVAVSAEKAFVSQSTGVSVEFDFKMDEVKEGALVCYLKDSSNVTGVSVLASSDGFKYYNGGTLTFLQSYNADTWYHFKIIANPETDKTDIYINGVLKASQGNFRNAVGNIGKIMMGGSTAGTNVTAYWNNIKVYNNTLINDSFNEQATDGTPQGWTLLNKTSGEIKIKEVPDSSDKSIQIYDNTNTLCVSAKKVFVPQSQVVTVEFDFKMEEVKEGALVCYLNNAVSILASSNGFGYIDGGTYTFIQTYSADTWYHFKVVANPITDKMDLFIDGVLKVSEGNFRNAVSNISEIIIGGSTSGTDVTAYWDNIMVYYN